MNGWSVPPLPALSQAWDRNKTGLIRYLTVLDAQRSLFSFWDPLAASEGTVTTDMAGLHNTLRGGWTSLALKAGPSGENESARVR